MHYGYIAICEIS